MTNTQSLPTYSRNDLLSIIDWNYTKSYWQEFDVYIWEIMLNCDDELLDWLWDLANIIVKRDISYPTKTTDPTKSKEMSYLTKTTSLTKVLSKHSLQSKEVCKTNEDGIERKDNFHWYERLIKGRFGPKKYKTLNESKKKPKSILWGWLLVLQDLRLH